MFETIISIFQANQNLILTMIFYTIVIVFYSIFVFYFYRFLAKKNTIELNLNQYNQYSSPFLIKTLAGIFYIIEYVIILPILTLFWFSILASLLLVIAKELDIRTILLITAALVTSVRVTSYVSEDLAKDLAKMLPFTLLAVAITTPKFFDVSIFFVRLTEIPDLFSSIPYYLIFMVVMELIMRIMEFIYEALETAETTEDI